MTPAVTKTKAEMEKMIFYPKTDEKALKEFLCYSKGFGEQKVDSGIQRLKKWQSRPNQSRLSNFFTLPQQKIVPINNSVQIKKGFTKTKSPKELAAEKLK